jgi:hypothetical protein
MRVGSGRVLPEDPMMAVDLDDPVDAGLLEGWSAATHRLLVITLG